MQIDVVWRVLRILGWRPFIVFGAMTAVIVFLLGTVQLSSRYALKAYAEDQLARVPWDMNVYQQNEMPRAPAVQSQISTAHLVERVETIYFLRTQFLGTVVENTTTSFIDGELVQAPWVSVLTATAPELLPPEARPERGEAVLLMTGSRMQLGDAFLATQNAKNFELKVRQGSDYSSVFRAPIERTVRMDRGELSGWFMEKLVRLHLSPSTVLF